MKTLKELKENNIQQKTIDQYEALYYGGNV